MISIFQFWTFYIHCTYINIPAAYVYSVYISVDISDIVVLMISLMDDSASQEATELKVSSGYHLESVVVCAITCSTVTEYLCHTWPRICSICLNHNPVLSPFLTYRWVWIKSSTMSNTSGAYRNCLPFRCSSVNRGLFPNSGQVSYPLPNKVHPLDTLVESSVRTGAGNCQEFGFFQDHCLSFRPFLFDHCVVFPLINGFRLILWYRQTVLQANNANIVNTNKKCFNYVFNC